MRRKMIIFFFVGLLSGMLLAFVWCTFLLRCEVTVSSIRQKNSWSQCKVLPTLDWLICIFPMNNLEQGNQALQFFLHPEWSGLVVDKQTVFVLLTAHPEICFVLIHTVVINIPHSDLIL